jgi:hypothetical protein
MGENMAITLLFEPKAGADLQYDSVMKDMKDQGIWPPEGMTYHVASGAGADFKVFEVWESEQHAQKFGVLLKPILQKHKIELSREPRPQPVKNTIKGKSL